jgi:hypothetical protein
MVNESHVKTNMNMIKILQLHFVYSTIVDLSRMVEVWTPLVETMAITAPWNKAIILADILCNSEVELVCYKQWSQQHQMSEVISC